MQRRVRSVRFMTGVFVAALVFMVPSCSVQAAPGQDDSRLATLEKKIAELEGQLKPLADKHGDDLRKRVESLQQKNSEALAAAARHQHDDVLWKALAMVGLAAAVAFVWRGEQEKHAAVKRAEAEMEKHRASVRRSEMAATARMWRSLGALGEKSPESLAVMRARLDGLKETFERASRDAVAALEQLRKGIDGGK